MTYGDLLDIVRENIDDFESVITQDGTSLDDDVEDASAVVAALMKYVKRETAEL